MLGIRPDSEWKNRRQLQPFVLPVAAFHSLCPIQEWCDFLGSEGLRVFDDSEGLNRDGGKGVRPDQEIFKTRSGS